MVNSLTNRLGLNRWSAATDALRRSQLDSDNAALEANAAMYAQGTFATRPAASKLGRFYYTTDTGRLYYDNGTAWREVALGVAWQNYDLTTPGVVVGVTLNTGGGARYVVVEGTCTVSYAIRGLVTGQVSFALPVPAAGVAGFPVVAGKGLAFRANSPTKGVADPVITSATDAQFWVSDFTALGPGSYGPNAWTATDSLRGTFTYETA